MSFDCTGGWSNAILLETLMKQICLLFFFAISCVVVAQPPPAAPPGDIYESASPAAAVEGAFKNLYELAAEITDDPSSGYRPAKGDQPDWPAQTAAQRQWQASMAAYGTGLTRGESAQLDPCAAHLNNAIGDMERGYRIQISQKQNAAAQKTAQSLYAKGRAEFALCSEANGIQGSTSTPTQPSPPVDTSTLSKLVAQLQDIMQQAGTAVDHFLAGLATWAENTGRFLAQKPGVPLSQAAQAIGTYLTSDYNANDAKLRAAAVEAVGQMQADPARFFGENLPNLLPLPKMLGQIARVEKATQRVTAVAKIEQEFAAAYNSKVPSLPKVPEPMPNMPATLKEPPLFAKNSCFPVAIAQDEAWANGGGNIVKSPFAFEAEADMAASRSDVYSTLEKRYGQVQRLYPGFTPDQKLAFSMGNPIKVSPSEISEYLGARGSRGLIFAVPDAQKFGEFLELAPGTEILAHAFNGRNLGNVIKLFDATVLGDDAALWFKTPLKEIF